MRGCDGATRPGTDTIHTNVNKHTHIWHQMQTPSLPLAATVLLTSPQIQGHRHSRTQTATPTEPHIWTETQTRTHMARYPICPTTDQTGTQTDTQTRHHAYGHPYSQTTRRTNWHQYTQAHRWKGTKETTDPLTHR